MILSHLLGPKIFEMVEQFNFFDIEDLTLMAG
jgi:hypothetical protein